MERNPAGAESVAAARPRSTAEALQELAAELSAAVMPTQVAHSLVARLPGLLGAVGGSLGLVHGDSLVVVDPGHVRFATLPAGLRVQLDASMPIAQAAHTAAPAYANTREEIERAFPDGFRLAPYASAFLAMPLMAGERVVGSMSFPFDTPGVVDADLIALARVAAALGGQAIERSQLYERERALREGLDRIARVAPRFAAESPEDLLAAICREARVTFDADVAELWDVGDDDARLACRQPDHREREPGMYFARHELPGFTEALERMGPVFTEGGSTDGPADAPFRMLGGRAFLQIPILAEAGNDRVLTLQWERDLLTMPPETLVLARRFADHASIALEHAARQQAQEAATRSARETRRLLDATTALAAATTPELVGAATLQELDSTLGADAGAVVALEAGEPVVIASSGYTPDELDGLRRLMAAGSSPLAHALDASELTIHESREALARDYPELAAATGHGAWLTIPLSAGGRVVGALGVSFAAPGGFATAELDYVVSVARQAGQALERTMLFATEHRARLRTERLQRLTAALSAAVTAGEVAETCLTETLDAVGAGGALLFLLDDDGRHIRLLASRGYPDELVDRWRSCTLAPGPARGRETPDLTGLVDDLEQLGHRTTALVPMMRGSASLGVAVLSWQDELAQSDDERRFIEALVAQCGLALDRAARYEAERTVAEALQRSVLPESIPSMQGVRVAARYLPGTTALDVGGDWFDTFALPGGRLAFAVGDIVGKGVRAAATMAQLRNGMRALALEDARPERTVTRINRLLDGITDIPFATLAYLTLDPRSYEVRIVSAGHLPPLVVSPNGETDFLQSGQNLPLGVDPTIEYDGSSTTLQPGSTVVLYTDGLVERRDRSIDAGLAQLAETVRAADCGPERLADTVVSELVGNGPRHDDVAVLVVALAATPLPDLALELPRGSASLATLRVELGRWLDRAAIPECDARDIMLASWEAVANAIEHASDRGDVGVHATLLGDRVRVEVRDNGSWKHAPAEENRGFGLRLIQSLMTATDIERSEDGTRVVFERTVTARSASHTGASA